MIKYLSVLIYLLISWCSKGQDVTFDKKNYALGDVIKVSVKSIDPTQTITITSDISGKDEDKSISSGQSTLLSKTTVPGIYNIEIKFDTLLTRYYQLFVYPASTRLSPNETNYFERIPFIINYGDKFSYTLFDTLKFFLQTDTTIGITDTSENIWMTSFKFFQQDSLHFIMTYGNYCLTGDCLVYKTWLEKKIAKIFVSNTTAGKFLTAMIRENPLIMSKQNISTSDFLKFTTLITQSLIPAILCDKTSTNFNLIFYKR